MNEQTTLRSLTDEVGVDISGETDPQRIIEIAGIDVPMEKAPVYDIVGESEDGKPEFRMSKEHFVLRRADTKEVYNTVKGKYEVVSTAEMIEPFVKATQRLGLSLNQAGLINGGRRIFLTAQMPDLFEVRSGDAVAKKVCALIFNDGYGSNSFLPIQERLYCANQLPMMKKLARELGLKVPHTKNYKDRIDQALFAVESAVEEIDTFNELCKDLAEDEFTELDMLGFTFALFPDTSIRRVSDAHDEDRRSTKLDSKRERVQELFREGRGNQGNSRFDALNAVSEYAQHEALARRVEKATEAAGSAGRKDVFDRAMRNNLISGTWNTILGKAVKLLSQRDAKGKRSKFRKFIPKGFKKD